MTVLRQLVNSQNIYNRVKTSVKIKSYDHILDVLRQRVAAGGADIQRILSVNVWN